MTAQSVRGYARPPPKDTAAANLPPPASAAPRRGAWLVSRSRGRGGSFAGECRTDSTRHRSLAGAAFASIDAVPEPFKPDDRCWAAFRVETGVNLRPIGPSWLGARVFDLLAPWRSGFQCDGQQQRAFSQKALMVRHLGSGCISIEVRRVQRP